MFELKAYSRKELAYMYFPDSSSPESACLNLNRLLMMSTAGISLKAAIHRRRLLTRKEVAAIVALLGEP